MRGQPESTPVIVGMLVPHLGSTVEQCVVALEAISLPSPHSPEEKILKHQLSTLMAKLWAPPHVHTVEITRVTEACIKHFETRFMGADTFIFGPFIHTSIVLGRGAEGTVYLGFRLADGKPTAIKKIDKATLLSSRLFEDSLDRQCEFLSNTANHPSIVKLYAVEKLESCWYCYFEFLDGGDLDSFLAKKDPSRPKEKIKVVLSEAKAKEIFRKLVVPVDYLRQHNVIHRDLKPSNFMLTRNGGVKLVDFATMREEMDAGDMAKSVKGTPAYMAPEIWDRKRAYEGEKVDVWSMGVILYEMVCGALPWCGESIPAHLHKVRSVPLSIPPSLGLGKELSELLVNLLKVNSTLRMSWAELISHEWLLEDPLSSNAVGNFLEERASQLEMQVEQLETRCKIMALDRDNKDGIIKELSRELQALQKQEGVVVVDEEAQNRYKETLLTLENQLQSAGVQHEELMQQLNSAQKQNTELEAETAECRHRMTLLDSDLAESRHRNTAFEEQLRELSNQLETTRTKSEQSESGLKEKVLLSVRRVEELQKELDASRRRETTARQAMEEERTSKELAQEAHSRLLNEATDNDRVTQTTLSRVSELNFQMAELVNERDAARQEVQVANSKHEALVAEKDRLLEDVMGNLAKSGEGQNRIEALESEIERLEEQVAHLKNDNASLGVIVRERYNFIDDNDNN